MTRPHNQYLIYQNFQNIEQKCGLPKKNKNSMDDYINQVFDAKIPRMSETDNLYSMPSTVSRLNCIDNERLSPRLPPCLLESERMQYVQHWINEIQDESHWRDLTLESEAVQSSSSGSGATNTGDNSSLIGSTNHHNPGSNSHNYGTLNGSGAIAGGLYDFLDNHSKKRLTIPSSRGLYDYNQQQTPPQQQHLIHNHQHHPNLIANNNNSALLPGGSTSQLNPNHHHLSLNQIQHPHQHQLIASTRFTPQETDLILELFNDYFKFLMCPGVGEVRDRLFSKSFESNNSAIALLAKQRSPQAIRAKIKRLVQQKAQQKLQEQQRISGHNTNTFNGTCNNTNNTNNIITNTNLSLYNHQQSQNQNTSNFVQSTNFNMINLQNDSANIIKTNNFYN